MEKITVGGPDDVYAARLIDEPSGMPASHEEIFTDDFMREYTEFGTYVDMLAVWGKQMEAATRMTDLADPDWEKLVARSTRFDTFRQMVIRATAEWLNRREASS